MTFGFVVFTKAGTSDINPKLHMHGYPSGDGDGLISHLPSVRFSPRVPKAREVQSCSAMRSIGRGRIIPKRDHMPRRRP